MKKRQMRGILQFVKMWFLLKKKKKSTFFFPHTQKVMNLPSLPLPDIQGQHKGDHQGSVAAQEVGRLRNWVNM